MTNADSVRAVSLIPTPHAIASRLLGDAAELLLRWEMFTFAEAPDHPTAFALQRATRDLCEKILGSGVASARAVADPGTDATPVAIEPECVPGGRVVLEHGNTSRQPAGVDTSNTCGVMLLDGGPAGAPGHWISFRTAKPGTLADSVTNHVRPDVALNLAAWLFSMCAQAAAPAAAAAITSGQRRPRSVGDVFASIIEAICR